VIASLELPSGIGLPDLFGEPQPIGKSMGTLQSQEQKTASWVIRGDVAGKYRITGVATGDLVLGGSRVPLISSLQSDEFEVVQPKLDVVFGFPQFVYAGEEFKFTMSIRNRSTIPIYGVSVNLKSDRFVNCVLADGETTNKVVGTMQINQTNLVTFRMISLVTGRINLERSFVVADPNIQPSLTINPDESTGAMFMFANPKVVNMNGVNRFQMRFYCPIGQHLVVQRSTDLKAWQDMYDFISTESVVIITDPELFDRAYYRVLVP
jgi:hypothetical protein